MSRKSREDAWTYEQDDILTQTVLAHIKTGKTQLQAFEEAGDKLGRTASACGFRWNAVLRHKYSTAIEMSKKERRALAKQKNKAKAKETKATELTAKLPGYNVTPAPDRFTPVSEVVYYGAKLSKDEILALKELLNSSKPLPLTLKGLYEDLNKMV